MVQDTSSYADDCELIMEDAPHQVYDDDNWRADRCAFKKGVIVAVCCVNRGMVKLDALLSEGHTRTWKCKDVLLICQRFHVDLLLHGVPRGVVVETME